MSGFIGVNRIVIMIPFKGMRLRYKIVRHSGSMIQLHVMELIWRLEQTPSVSYRWLHWFPSSAYHKETLSQCAWQQRTQLESVATLNWKAFKLKLCLKRHPLQLKDRQQQMHRLKSTGRLWPQVMRPVAQRSYRINLTGTTGQTLTSGLLSSASTHRSSAINGFKPAQPMGKNTSSDFKPRTATDGALTRKLWLSWPPLYQSKCHFPLFKKW